MLSFKSNKIRGFASDFVAYFNTPALEGVIRRLADFSPEGLPPLIRW